MARFKTATVFLFCAVQLQAAFAQSAVYDIDISGTGDSQGLVLHVFGTLDVDLATDQIVDSNLQFQIGGNAATDLFLSFNNEDGTGIVDFFDVDGELFVIAESNPTGTIGPLWETLDAQSLFEIFSGFVSETGGVVMYTNLFGGDGLEIAAPSPNGARLGTLTVPEPVLGDFDDDMDVDADDVDFYNGNVGQPASFNTKLDLNNDGTITLADHNLHVMTLVMTSNGVTGALLGDVNLDGMVDVLNDAFILVGSLGQSVTSRSQGDLNADGAVDVLNDAFILVGQLGQSNAP